MAQTTELSVLCVPGIVHTFAPAGIDEGEHIGEFTALGLLGVPGIVHEYVAKGATVSRRKTVTLTGGVVTEIVLEQ